jgi:hypothetical protein
MLADLYQDMPDDTLAAMFAGAWRDLRADPRKRSRGLPPAVSAELSSQARELLQCSQREAERLLYGADEDVDGAAEGRVARRREHAEASMSFDTARDLLASMAWGSAGRRRPDWLAFIEAWWARLDFLEAAGEAVKSNRRRLDPSNPAAMLDAFRACLVKRARLAELEGDIRLKRWAADPMTQPVSHGRRETGKMQANGG